MAQDRFTFPNGSILELATVFAEAKTVTSITNAKPPEATSVAHGLTEGDIVLLRSGWSRINGRGVRVGAVEADEFELAGLDTSKTARFSAGRGVGSILLPTRWQQVDKILEVSSSGGEQQFWTGAYLEDDDETQVPTTRNPQSMSLSLGDDPDSDRDAALQEADESKEEQLLRLTLPSGNIILYTGYVSYNDNPQMQRNNPMSGRVVISLTARPTRYTAL
ncbi:MAG: phage tail protein [Corticimicrobacter sp.]|uniref:phage tail protein n=1 Tax=Corticimicrobacter sp. TaxID=2678536 RepID=UPI0032DA9E2C